MKPEALYSMDTNNMEIPTLKEETKSYISNSYFRIIGKIIIHECLVSQHRRMQPYLHSFR